MPEPRARARARARSVKSPFDAVHRSARRAAVGRGLAALLLGGGLVAGIAVVPSPSTTQAQALAYIHSEPPVAAPAAAEVPPAPVAADPSSPPAAGVPVDAGIGSLPTPASSPTSPPALQAPPPLQPPTAEGPDHYTIDIGAVGHQREVDQCQWVRMDIGAVAPIVGAHTSCGGAIVLDLALGDIIDLNGTGLDGTYQVAESRDARAGDPAGTATAGMSASVILQTCYRDRDAVRLVALEPASAVSG